MPDIDMDFDERRRGDMIRYATEKYGEERVAQIITYGTIKAKAAVKDAGRVLGYPFALGDRITKAMPPPVMGKDIPLTGIFDPTHPRYPEAAEFRSLYESEPDVQKVVDTAKGLEGLKRQWGVHAAGVILSREPLVDVLPIQKREQDGAIITQWDMDACESIGLLKMDFLGLRNLTVMDDCLDNIKANRGVDLVLEELALDDDKTLTSCWPAATRSACSSSTAGRCARCCARWCRTASRTSPPCSRCTGPGPMGANAHNDYADRKNKRKPVVPIHPELAEPLGRHPRRHLRPDRLPGTGHGDRAEARRLLARRRRPAAPGDGQEEEGDPRQGVRAVLRAACGSTATPTHAIKTLWDILVPFSDYAFNKAHTAGYGLVSFWTAYLKANYPAEYMAALLTSVGDDKDKSAVYLAECRRMGIKVLPPDVNAVGGPVHLGRRGHPVRPGRGAQRRRQRGRVDRPGAQGEGRVHRLLRLPAQGRRGGLQQEDHRVADQGGRVRLARAHPARAARGARRRDRLVPRRQAQRGGRAVRPVRRPVRRRPRGATRRSR